MVWLKPSHHIKLCREMETKAHLKEERPPLPDGRDGLARSFMHSANQDPVNLYRRSVNLETTTVNGRGVRSVWRLAPGAWFLSGEWLNSLGHLIRCRWSVDRRGAQELAYRRTELAVG